MRRYVYTRLPQMLRSWYIFFFQIPWLPEALFSALDFRTPPGGDQALGTI